jgi:hypothetical protein
MPNTVVGLFKSSDVAEKVVIEIESVGFARNEVQSLREPLDFGIAGVTSIPEVDFEVELFRELTRIGATRQLAEDYVEGVRQGGVLIFATGTEEEVGRATEIMNRNGGVDTQEASGPEPNLPNPELESESPRRGSQVQAGRERRPGGGATFFVW